MKTIRAVYEKGVFRPIGPADPPEGSPVTVEPAPDAPRQPRPTDPEFAHLEPGLREICAMLSHRYDGGSPDASARHDEHQP